ncbi:TonB-dependent siderophore receptor [Duganella sp. sic0402]|uniref:TonB-dependent siderophore receptor n=1 Tax=Duganella sp. sic0402 TaxID=2854786 RepID=UPI001C44F7AC|nr:TonB-dependent siderophore receptor [Duganella sp. sic0402]MBV7538417.1 TonB-dependent siderophore receptor [Duganella sp. sic0402]
MHPPLRTALSLALLGLSATAHGEDTDPPVLPSVTVTGASESSYTTRAASTATGLSLSIRDTPQSVSVITRERIEDQALQTVFDIATNATGVSAKEIDSVRGYFYARGFEIKQLQIDGVPMYGSDAGQAKADMAIYEQVEIVRGASGLLNGTGSPSASINLIRKHADSKTFTGTVSAAAGSWQKREAEADLSAPLNTDGSIRGRVVVNAEQKNNFIDLENTRQRTLYGVIDADLGAVTHLSIGYSQQNDKHRGSQWAGLPIFYSDGTRTDWPRSKSAAAKWNFWDTEQRTGFVTLEHTLANQWKVTAMATRRENNGDQRLNWMSGLVDRNTGLGLDPWVVGYGGIEEQTDYGVTASGPFTLLGRKHEATIGVLHGKHKQEWLVSDASEQPPIGDFRNWNGDYPEPQWGAYYSGSSYYDTQTSIYGATRLQITDPFKIIAGARVTDWKRDAASGAWTDAPYTIRHNGKITPYLGGVYDIGANSSLYASYTSIFDPQTMRDRSGAYIDPLEGKSYEAGVKSELFGGKASASFAVFMVKQENFAVVDPGQFVPNTREQAYTSIDGAETKGYEMELSGELARGWSASIGWTQFRSEDRDGNPVNTVHPHKLLKLYTRYQLPGDWHKLSVGGGVNWEGSSYTRVVDPRSGASFVVSQPSYALASLMARYDISRDLSLQVNVNNLFDKKYYSNQLDVFQNLIYGAPRNVLATLRYKF